MEFKRFMATWQNALHIIFITICPQVMMFFDRVARSSSHQKDQKISRNNTGTCNQQILVDIKI